ncbi:MAG: cobalamin B12-binding domain-containing protein [Desulfobacteraceae bacterium]
MTKKIKVLLAKLGLDVHNRGIITVAKALSRAGMEVVYLGNALPAEIVSVAIQEDADVVGVSSLGGAHISLGSLLLKEAEEKRLKDKMAFVMGGVFGPSDGERLKDMGFDRVFVPGATSEQIVSGIQNLA